MSAPLHEPSAANASRKNSLPTSSPVSDGESMIAPSITVFVVSVLLGAAPPAAKRGADFQMIREGCGVMFYAPPKPLKNDVFCPPGATYEAALKQLGELDQRISDATDADVDELYKQLEGLIDKACFRLAARLVELERPESGAAFRYWWNEQGVYRVLSGALSGFESSCSRKLMVSGSPRRFLSPTADPDLRPWLCSSRQDAGCVASEAWRSRLEESIGGVERFGIENRPWCAELVSREPLSRRFVAWLACMGRKKLQRPALGLLRAPAQGWLAIAVQPHNLLSLYHLASGATYQVQLSASFKEKGAVTLVEGQVSVDNLREAAWALLLSTSAEDVEDSEIFTLPWSIPMRTPKDSGISSGVVGGVTCQATAIWSLVSGEGRINRSTEWWSPNNTAVLAASKLFDVVNAGLIKGCTKAKPSEAEWTQALHAVSFDKPEQLEAIQAAVKSRAAACAP